jgi:hypothetical protein
LIEIEALKHDYGIDLAPKESRPNILTRSVSLITLSATTSG